MDSNDVDTIRLNALGGKDTTTVNNLTVRMSIVAIDPG
jgi:hypothetical protein